MSDFHGIGAVSATLETLLTDRMQLPDGVTHAPVTISPPAFSSKDVNPRLEPPRVCLFLYRVTENAQLRNQDLPGRGSPGAYGHPPLSLDLHYLLTAYGNAERPGTGHATSHFDDTTAHFLLGSALQVLHDVPVITDRLTTVRAPSGQTVLHESLHGDCEHLRLRLETLSLEDMSKIWTALALRYRLSAAFAVNVVQIESQRQRRTPRAVGRPASAVTGPQLADPPAPGPAVQARTVQPPTITGVRVRRAGATAEQPYPYARIGDTLVLQGSGLAAPETTVAFGDLRVLALRAERDRVEVVVPDAALPDGAAIDEPLRLRPGVRTVRVVVRDPRITQSTLSSNEAAVMLVPAVDSAIVYAAGPPRAVTIRGSRLTGPGPGTETVIGRSVVPGDKYLGATGTTIVVPVPDTLPARGTRAVVSAPLPDPVCVSGHHHPALTVVVGADTHIASRSLPAKVPLAELPGLVAAMIHDAAPDDPRCAGTRVQLWSDRLVIVPGGLVGSLAIKPHASSSLADELGLTAAQPPGASSGFLSGVLGDGPVVLSAGEPRVRLTIGTQPGVTLAVPRAMSLSCLADALRDAITAASPAPEYASALVGTCGSQLLVIPGKAATVAFGAAEGDDTTVTELQLSARFAVRVRVNGAESTDEAWVELPQ
ncbi:DUF4255 domain-containing protein [Streptomyces sp. NPDC058320]|uniref:DUF4255 domain-containing protein n=1 Tax=unclassified Streptomyces TaxID=2593676 RepID=UPI00362E297E